MYKQDANDSKAITVQEKLEVTLGLRFLARWDEGLPLTCRTR